ncbi:MAG: twin transmembrane helix small protein [Gammaproteobacteria bacterium]
MPLYIFARSRMVAAIIIVVLFALVVLSLGQALYYLAHDRGESKRTMKALSWRVGLAGLLLVLLFALWGAGVLHPHG